MRQAENDPARRRRFDALCARWRDDLYRFVFWLARDHAIAEDVVQETMLRAWKSFDSLADESAAKSWLITIARREHARVYERVRPQMVNLDELGFAEQARLGTEPDSDIRDLRAAIAALEDTYREPLVLQVLMGYSTEEIAELLGIKQNAVLTRLFRARKQLKAALEGQGAGG
jgi:RNA polymerase sigma-70 factor (ECF subfamily)